MWAWGRDVWPAENLARRSTIAAAIGGAQDYASSCLVCHDTRQSARVQVKVSDRTVIVTTDAETRVSEPKGLQALIDAAVAGVPSGGEDGMCKGCQEASMCLHHVAASV